MSDKYVHLDRLRPFSETLSVTFELIRNVFKPLMILLLSVAGPLLVVGAIGSEYTQDQRPYEAILSGLGMGDSTSDQPLLLFWLTIIVNLFADLVASVIVVIYFLEYHRLKRLPTASEMRFALRGVWLRAFVGWFARMILMILGFLVLIVPGIYLSIALSLVIVAQFAESLSVGDALKRSMTLIKNDWWWALLFLVLIFLCAAVVELIVDVPGSALYFVEAMTKDTGSGVTITAVQIVGSIVRVVAQILTTCVTALASTAVVVLYYRELERTEGSGLLERISAIGGGDVTTPSSEPY